MQTRIRMSLFVGGLSNLSVKVLSVTSTFSGVVVSVRSMFKTAVESSFSSVCHLPFMIRSDYINGSNNRITLADVIQVSSLPRDTRTNWCWWWYIYEFDSHRVPIDFSG